MCGVGRAERGLCGKRKQRASRTNVYIYIYILTYKQRARGSAQRGQMRARATIKRPREMRCVHRRPQVIGQLIVRIYDQFAERNREPSDTRMTRIEYFIIFYEYAEGMWPYRTALLDQSSNNPSWTQLRAINMQTNYWDNKMKKWVVSKRILYIYMLIPSSLINCVLMDCGEDLYGINVWENHLEKLRNRTFIFCIK